MDGYIVGSNNPSSRPAYNSWNGFFSQTLPHNLTVNVGVQNVFNQAAQDYGYFGHAPLTPENRYYSDTTPIQQYLTTGSNEEFGLPVRSFTLTLSSHV
jgi:outer membrane receptor protein involved in Fe transport